MPFKFRPTPMALYRLFFVVMLLAIGAVSLSVALLEIYTDLNILPFDPGTNYEAILATCVVTGISGLFAGNILLALMLDRRTSASDRRQQSVAIDFPDRRKGNRR